MSKATKSYNKGMSPKQVGELRDKQMRDILNQNGRTTIEGLRTRMSEAHGVRPHHNVAKRTLDAWTAEQHAKVTGKAESITANTTAPANTKRKKKKQPGNYGSWRPGMPIPGGTREGDTPGSIVPDMRYNENKAAFLTPKVVQLPEIDFRGNLHEPATEEPLSLQDLVEPETQSLGDLSTSEKVRFGVTIESGINEESGEEELVTTYHPTLVSSEVHSIMEDDRSIPVDNLVPEQLLSSISAVSQAIIGCGGYEQALCVVAAINQVGGSRNFERVVSLLQKVPDNLSKLQTTSPRVAI